MTFNPNDWSEGGADDEVFGMPSCMLDLGLKALALLAPELLALIIDAINKAIAAARNYIADLVQPLFDWLGSVEYDTLLGLLGIKLDLGFLGVDSVLLGAVATLAGIGAVIDTLGAYYDMALEELSDIKDCLDKFKGKIDRERGPQGVDSNGNTIPLGPTAADEFLLRFKIDEVGKFIDKANGLLGRIGTVIQSRANGDSLDPSSLLSLDDIEEDAIFRLTYGPPESKVGTFLLSVDGLYYDSQDRAYSLSGGIPTVEDIGFVPNRDRWSMDHAPSLGGKGTKITIGDINKYVDTILDIENLDESDLLRRHYEQDHLLNSLDGYKSKNITDLNRSKQDLVDDGHATSSAIYINFQQQIFSEIEIFDLKIRKRKKQIELAVKAPDLFGLADTFEPGEVPVNDFSYLNKIHLNVALEKQRKLVLDHGEVSGVILPMKPIFVGNSNSENSVTISPLLVSQTGVGTVSEVYSPEKSNELLPVLTLTDPIAVTKLVSVYNFLDSEVVTPESNRFTVLNCNGDIKQNAQIVGKTSADVFSQGLAIPKLKGIIRYEDDPSSDFLKYKGLGSYIKLPQTPEMQNLMYNPDGCSFDFWLHMSGLGEGQNDWESNNTADFNLGNDASSDAAWTDFNYYKIILANDNTGGTVSDTTKTDIQNAGNVVINKSTDRVRGMMMGFTRDPLFTSGVNTAPETDTGLDASTATAAGTSFFIAPTQSWSSSGVGFLRSDDCIPESSTYRGLRIPITNTTSNGSALSSASTKFVHLSVTFDVRNDLIQVYLNSELLQEETISSVFGTKQGEPPKVPSFKKDNSFQYGMDTIPISQTLDFKGGPKNDSYFTPWILGGAWTDGLFIDTSTSSGGFMGTGSGMYSGLGGHLGSFKIYSKPLTKVEVLKNYEAHRILFSNINLS
tara:strand:+ start:26231 stop:28936 length:2706 start_codon:yes stop_codon:yes gene_type:complete